MPDDKDDQNDKKKDGEGENLPIADVKVDSSEKRGDKDKEDKAR